MKVIKKPLLDTDGEVREITSDDLKCFKPASEALPTSLQTKLGIRSRGAQKNPTKERITIRLSAEVVESFRSCGPGWQTRLDNALKDWLKTHSQ